MRFMYYSLVLLFICSSCIALADDDVIGIEQYQQHRLVKRSYERFLYANEMLLKAGDIEVIKEAVQDAIRYATNKDENQQTLNAIESAMKRLPVDGEAHREAMLAWGKMLTRLHRWDLAKPFFQDAISNNWHNAMLRYSESLIESGRMAESCILEFNRIAGLDKYKNYLGAEESLEIFLTLLRMAKNHDPSISVVDDVSQRLDDITDKPIFTRIAKALCMAEDGYPDEAVSILDEIDVLLSKKKEHREYKHIPLYKASILYKQGVNFPAAEAAFTKFMKRNEGKDEKIIASALRLARDLLIQRRKMENMDEFASFLIESDWFKDDSMKQDLPVESVASLYDMQQIGLVNSGKGKKGLEICRFVMDNFPGTLAAANCSQIYFHSISSTMPQDKLVEFYQQILDQTDDDTLKAIVYYYLSKISRKNGDIDTALEHIEEALGYVNPYKKGIQENLYDTCIDFKARIEETKKTFIN